MNNASWALDGAEVDRLVEEVVAGMMGRPPTHALNTSTPTTWTAQVNVHGAWSGSIAIRSGPAFAQQAAGVMFGADGQDTSDASALEALGELANVLAGNIKSALASRLGASCSISLPQAASGTGPAAVGTVVYWARRTCDDAPFEVCVMEALHADDGAKPEMGLP